MKRFSGNWISDPQEVAKERRRHRFEQLTRPHLKALYRTALRMTGDSQTAEDLTQEACLRAYRAFDSYADGTNYQAWIFKIMTNLCADHLRREARAPFAEVSDSEVEGAIGRHSRESDRPDVRLLHKTFRSDAFRAMANLPPEIRLVVSLALLEEFSYQEIADIANCPIGTVRSRLSRGRQQLQNELRGYLPGQPGGRTASVTQRTAKKTPPAKTFEPNVD